MNMLKISSLFAAAALATSVHATTLTLADTLGNIDPGSPASLADEAGYINNLINNVPALNTPVTITGHTYVRLKDTSALPDATEVGSVKQNAENDDKSPNANFTPGNIDVSGWTYLLAKYADISYVWFVGDLADGIASIATSITVTVTQPNGNRMEKNQGLSHYSVFNPTSVPDSASTLALLGLGLSSLGLMARRRKA